MKKVAPVVRKIVGSVCMCYTNAYVSTCFITLPGC